MGILPLGGDDPPTPQRAPPTTRCPVVLSPEAAAALLRHVASALNGYSVYRGASFLAGRMGEVVASELVTVVDDPLHDRMPGARGFDGEGLATRPTVHIRGGRLETWILDTYAAKKRGLQSNRQASRALGSPPRAGAARFQLCPGNQSPEDIVASVEDGLYLTELIGFGVNEVTGDFSKGGAGLRIRKGELCTLLITELAVGGSG